MRGAGEEEVARKARRATAKAKKVKAVMVGLMMGLAMLTRCEIVGLTDRNYLLGGCGVPLQGGLQTRTQRWWELGWTPRSQATSCALQGHIPGHRRGRSSELT